MGIFDLICCPLCRESLCRENNSLVCLGAKRHCYDISASGYVNLLPPGKEKNSKTGDEKAMLSARSVFLERGAYSPISEKVGELISGCSEIQNKKEISFVDAGSGEGWHTCNIISCLSKNGIKAVATGFDASKHGAAMGAKRARRLGFDTENAPCVFFAAGNIFSLPIKDSSLDFAISMFAPIAGDEMKRVLKNDGRLIVVSSGRDHLSELKALLYDEVRFSDDTVKIPDGFSVEKEDRLTYSFTVTGNEILKSLFVMTPFYYKTSLSDKAKLENVNELTITADVKYTVLKPEN